MKNFDTRALIAQYLDDANYEFDEAGEVIDQDAKVLQEFEENHNQVDNIEDYEQYEIEVLEILIPMNIEKEKKLLAHIQENNVLLHALKSKFKSEIK